MSVSSRASLSITGFRQCLYDVSGCFMMCFSLRIFRSGFSEVLGSVRSEFSSDLEDLGPLFPSILLLLWDSICAYVKRPDV